MTQIFIDEIPLFLLTDVLDKFFIKNKDAIEVDYIGYKKVMFHKYHIEWLDDVRKYYHKSKRFYVDRKFTYNSFVNILRQICRLYNIEYISNQDKNTGYKYFKYKFYI
jgi:hypothetical protein